MKSKPLLTNTTKNMDANKKGSGRCPLIRKGKHRVLAFVFFLVYFVVLFYFLFFSEEMGRTYSERAYHYNLIAFMPFGSFLPIYSKRCRNVWMTVLYSFELSLLVELLQLVFKVGSFDVDDLFLNTIGGLLGYLVYKVLLYLWKRYEKARHIVNK